MKVLYITFADLSKPASSGSAVRPLKMLKAWEKEVNEVRWIDGAVNDYMKRMRACKKVNKWLEEWKPDICYIELPSGPIFYQCDRKLLKKLHKMEIPIGAFYRDAYWRFPEFTSVNEKKSLKIIIKGKVIYLMQKRDWKMYCKTCKALYFPSMQMAEYFECANKKILAPGCDERQVKNVSHNKIPVGIYVGGATERYGLPLLIKSAIKCNRNKTRVELNIVCAREGWENFVSQNKEMVLQQYEWLHVYHIGAGAKLEELYSQSDFSIVPLLNNKYNNFAFPIKLVEYVSHLLPVLTTDCTVTKEFVEKYKIGIVSQDNVQDFCKALEKMSLLKDFDIYKNACEEARRNNLWTERVKKVIDDLG